MVFSGLIILLNLKDSIKSCNEESHEEYFVEVHIQYREK